MRHTASEDPEDSDRGEAGDHRGAAESHPDRVPQGLLGAFLAAFCLVLAAYFFVIFCVTRGLLRGVGFSVSTMVECLAVTLVMAGFVVWLAPMSHFLEAWFLHRIPAKRARRGLCPACGHPLPGPIADGDGSTARCAECGGDFTLRRPFEFGWQGIRRFLAIAGVAYAIGTGCAIARIAADERAFVREYSLSPGVPHYRPRAWPAAFATLSYDGEFATSTSVAEPAIEPGWRPRERREGANENGPHR
ncbi:MAG: hypothetical protein JNL80_03545 [Phycisphaerae bacterium]|nr:hypothetical protein [Phycisphaerae bacterium]